jgi:hypothetical protein
MVIAIKPLVSVIAVGKIAIIEKYNQSNSFKRIMYTPERIIEAKRTGIATKNM